MYMDYDDAYPSMTPEEEDAAIDAEWEGREFDWLNDTWSDEWLVAFEMDNLNLLSERNALQASA